MPIPASVLTLAAGILLALISLWVGQNINVMPVAAADDASTVDALFKVLFSIGVGLLLGITAMLVVALVQFRRRPGDHLDGPAVEGNLPLEIFWTAVPAIVILMLGVYSYDIYARMGGMADFSHHTSMPPPEVEQASLGNPADPETVIWGGIDRAEGMAFPVEVTAMQFAFIFHYPQQNFTTGELHLPLGQPVELRLKSNDVIHAFWVPEFRLKQDVIPGQPTVLSFTANRQGDYDIICAELCGPYHGGMRSKVVVEDSRNFEEWLIRNTPTTVATAPDSSQTA
ncbi:MAG: cytochrome C oxidase subunit II [Candidatus Synechococcus spongiarum 142]|uniref:Cytochrome c oxidase subunit 2 n=1 Tax=Candidatus Synechococcus spongiarum 142 TaxID=1608213 RepID=A0A6N3XBZ8_9SYNE|nr:MAG: cytochrome C oxidase subunit II [Candidatus Synechococcus spongiarum 142]